MGLLDANLGDVGAAAMTQLAYEEGKSGLTDFANAAQTGQEEAFNRFGSSLEFKPFTVTTGTGGTAGYNNGQLSLQGSPQEQAMTNQMFQGAQNMYQGATQDVAGRANDIYGSMMTAMSPEMERQRLANEERMLAQGRMGMSSNAYGGMNPDEFNLNKAQQEAMNNAYLGARQSALGEQNQMANIGQSMFTQAYLPQAQQLQAFQAARNAADMEQRARQQYGTTGMESYLTGLDAQLQANLGKSNLTQGYMSSLADIMRPIINPQTGEPYSDTGMFGGATLNDLYGFATGMLGLGQGGTADPYYYDWANEGVQ
jgi:hypothetical protein